MLDPALERAGSEFSDATLATGAGNTTWSNNDPKKGLHADVYGPTDFSGQSFFGSRNSEPYFGWLAEHKFERNNEFTGSILKGNWLKNGKKQVAFDGNRRNTYKQSIYYHIVGWASVGIWLFENSSSFCCKSEDCHLEGCLEEDRTVIACWNQLCSWMGWRKCSVPKAIGNS